MGAATTLVSHPRVAEFFEAVLSRFAGASKAANWITTEVMRGVQTHGLDATFPVSPEQIAELLQLMEDGAISGKQAKEVYAAIEGSEQSPKQVVAERGMKVVSDAGAILEVCKQVVAKNPKSVEQYQGGKKGTLGFFVGQVMKETKGSADPKQVNELLRSLLDEPT
jgi:aspartyl-tRNA(Asn)/glutamyl-tRNA(Gln) amidotransferase subunit B